MEPLIITQCDFTSFKIPFIRPFTIAGQAITERSGYYLTIKTSDAKSIQGEASLLEGVSQEMPRRAMHDLKESRLYLKGFKFPTEKDALLELLRHDPHILNLCGSVRFAVESVILGVAAQSKTQSLTEYLGAESKDVQSAVLLQGNHQEVMSDFKKFYQQGARVFKLKVGDRNIALDVKKIEDIRMLMEEDSYLRLDANQGWSLKEACIFAELAGNRKIDYIEEPLNDISQLDAFYQKTHMRVGLDETLRVVRCGVTAPGRCSPPLAGHEGVVAYVLKPTILGLVPCLDWIEEAQRTRRKAVISSSFESPVGLKVLANLACFAGQISGLGTERWFKNTGTLVGDNGIIKKESLV